jgi:hypothetical protein
MIRQTVLGFKIENTQEELTAHGGLALMSEYNHGMGLRELSDRHLPAAGSNRGYNASVFVDSLVLMLQGGGQCLEDLRELERETALMKLLRMDRIPDPDTGGDWLRRMGHPENGGLGYLGLGNVRDAINHRILRSDSITEYTLDADATQVMADKHDAKFTYKGVKGYMPMLGFLFENQVCLLDEFREGNVSPGSDQLGFYRQCKGRMPKGKRIARYRADSASYQAELINKLEKDSVKWAITADQDSAVKKIIHGLSETEWTEPLEGCGFDIAETIHTMNKTDKAFRLVIKREYFRQADIFEGSRYAYHVVASNWSDEEKSAYEVLKWHNQRGAAENFNKELKSGFGMERMPCGDSWANAVFFRIGVIAYNLFIGFKRLSCPEAWVHHTIATFRWKVVQVAGRIVRHAGQVILRLVVDADNLSIFKRIRQRCFELSIAT